MALGFGNSRWVTFIVENNSTKLQQDQTQKNTTKKPKVGLGSKNGLEPKARALVAIVELPSEFGDGISKERKTKLNLKFLQLSPNYSQHQKQLNESYSKIKHKKLKNPYCHKQALIKARWWWQGKKKGLELGLESKKDSSRSSSSYNSCWTTFDAKNNLMKITTRSNTKWKEKKPSYHRDESLLMAIGQKKEPKLELGFKKDSSRSSSFCCSSPKVSELKNLSLNSNSCLQTFKWKSKFKLEFHLLLQLNLSLVWSLSFFSSKELEGRGRRTHLSVKLVWFDLFNPWAFHTFFLLQRQMHNENTLFLFSLHLCM